MLIHVLYSFSRSAAIACVEDGLGWASSVFPTNDVRSRSTSSKSQFLGKHKLPMSELTRPSKSKKISMEHGEMQHVIAERVFNPLPGPVPMDHDLRFNLTSPITKDVEIDDFASTSHSDIGKEFSLEVEDFEEVPHSYVPGLIAGLDDCSSLPECTDIG